MRYECGVCGYIYDESKTSSLWNNLNEGWQCPICDAAKVYFSEKEKEQQAEPEKVREDKLIDEKINDIKDLSYLSGFERHEDNIENYMDIIHEMAKTGEPVIEPMRSRLETISWQDILILGAQLDKFVLDEHDEVKTTTIIGKNAKIPLVIENPVFVTHMSFGALSKEFKLSLAKGSAEAKTAMCSGEGGIIPKSMEAAYKYIFEYVPNKYSVTDENLKKVDAIEIKIGQGSKPGMGGHLPAEKVTEEIAKIRDKKVSQDIISPSKFNEIKTKEDLKRIVEELRIKSEGRPIGIKIAAGHIEKDLGIIAFAKPDFVTIDGRAGGTGASPKLIKDATTMPTIFALCRARKYLDDNNLDMDLIITGGLRVSSDFAKALAIGADAIAIGSAAMMAAACQQYRVCNTGKCPVGCATQDEELRKRLNQDNSALRLMNFLNVSLEELKTFARITGHDDVHKISIKDLCTINSEISDHTTIKHV
jgi:methylamine---glutamate N-methyltransferase subunit C